MDGRFVGESLAGLGLVLLAGAALVAVLVVAEHPLVALDHAVASGLNSVVAPHPGWVETLQVLTLPGSTTLAAAILSTLVLALVLRRQYRLAMFAAVTGIGGAVLGPAVKDLVGRVRPVVAEPVATATGPSFPSGHTLTVTVWVGIVLLVLLPAVPERARRPVLGAGVALAVIVGFTRLALGVHYVTDVVGAYLLGLGWLTVTTHAFQASRRREHLPAIALQDGLEPEAAPELVPAPDPGPPARPWRTAAQLTAAAVPLLGLVASVGMLVTRLGPAAGAADLAGAQWFVAHREPALDGPSQVATELGGTGTMIGVAAVAVVLTLAVLRRWRPALVIAAALVGEVLIFLAGSAIVDRPRPPVPHLDAALPPTSSFPSGHVAAAICTYGAIAAVVFSTTHRWWRWPVVAVAVGLVLTVAFARLYRGAHYPSDVLGSVLLGLTWLAVTLRLVGTRELPARPPPASPPPASRASGAARG